MPRGLGRDQEIHGIYAALLLLGLRMDDLTANSTEALASYRQSVRCRWTDLGQEPSGGHLTS